MYLMGIIGVKFISALLNIALLLDISMISFKICLIILKNMTSSEVKVEQL